MSDYSELKKLAEAAMPDDASPYLPCPVAFMNAATPAAVLALIAESERYRKYGCDTCDGSGHLHRIDGEYYGACTSCGAYELEQAKRERDKLKAEVEALRKQIDDMSPLKGAPLTVPDLKCLACGGYHYGMSGLPCPKMVATASASTSQGEQT